MGQFHTWALVAQRAVESLFYLRPSIAAHFLKFSGSNVHGSTVYKCRLDMLLDQLMFLHPNILNIDHLFYCLTHSL